MSGLDYEERPAAGEAEGLLILHHGRGSDEHDLLGLADVLDPERRLHVVTPGGPLTLPGWGGRHWYVVPRVGYPDPETFRAAHAALADFHDALWERTGLGPKETVLGGFSMGAVMSFALGLDPARPAPAAIPALSGFVPVVDGWTPDVARRAADGTRVLIAHGRADPVIGIDFAQRAEALLRDGGVDVEYLESDASHHVDPAQVPGWRRRSGSRERGVRARRRGAADRVRPRRVEAWARDAGGFALLCSERGEASLPTALRKAAATLVRVPDGPVDEVAAALRGEVAADELVAFGGGRVIDTAKALAAADPPRRVVAIPTTLSAAEMTQVHRHARGVAPGTPHARAAVVLNDPALSGSQPLPGLAASTANALGHAVAADANV